MTFRSGWSGSRVLGAIQVSVFWLGCCEAGGSVQNFVSLTTDVAVYLWKGESILSVSVEIVIWIVSDVLTFASTGLSAY